MRAGEICVICGRSLSSPHTPGEKKCPQYGGSHWICRFFFERSGWYCQFLEADCKTPLLKKLTFKNEEKIMELAERSRAMMNLEVRQATEHATRVLHS
jgi:hypothetical protein